MSRSSLPKVCAIIGLIAVAVIGCGGGTSGVVPVEGTLTYQGQPVEGVSVQFEPVAGNRPSTGATDASGHFVLIYSIDEDGAEVGKHNVTFDWQPLSENEQPSEAITKIVEKHGPEDGAPLEVEIAGATSDLVLNIE